MGRFLIRWAITAGAVAVAAWLVPGIYVDEPHRIWAVLLVALVLGLVNAFIRPIVALLSCGCIVLTLGLFTLVINALMLLSGGVGDGGAPGTRLPRGRLLERFAGLGDHQHRLVRRQQPYR